MTLAMEADPPTNAVLRADGPGGPGRMQIDVAASDGVGCDVLHLGIASQGERGEAPCGAGPTLTAQIASGPRRVS